MSRQPKRIFLVCGEPSGDLHAAELVRELRGMADVEVVAAGGPRLEAVGAQVKWISTDWGAIGVPQALAKLPLYLRMMKQLVREIVAGTYQMVVLVDFGAFNLRLAARVRRRRPGLPIFYYFPPSSWDRRRRRWDRLLTLTDFIATPFPWNAALLAAQGATVRWVGHPAVDRIGALSRDEARERLGIPEGRQVVALLPGSRRLERNLLGPVFLRAADLIREAIGDLLVLWSRPPAGQDAPSLEQAAEAAGATEVAEAAVILQAADVALTSFGTVTLEAAIAGCPLVTAYRGTLAMRITFALMNIPTPWYSMPNIILQQSLVPELVGDAATPERLAKEAVRLLTDQAARETMLDGFARVRRALGPPGAARRAAQMLLDALSGRLRPHRRPLG